MYISETQTTNIRGQNSLSVFSLSLTVSQWPKQNTISLTKWGQTVTASDISHSLNNKPKWNMFQANTHTLQRHTFQNSPSRAAKGVNTKHVGPLHYKTTYRRCGRTWVHTGKMSPFCLFTLWVCWWSASVRAWDYLFISGRFVTFRATRRAVRVTWKWKQEGCPAALRGPTKWHIRTEAQKCRIIIPSNPNKTSRKRTKKPKLLWTAQREEIYSHFLYFFPAYLISY